MADVAEALVLGAGVSGLTTAIRLAEAGIHVRVIARLPPPDTTSACAGASWGPYLVRDGRILHWSHETLEELQTIAAATPDSGVRLVHGVEAADFPMDAPDWARAVDGFRVCVKDELPTGYVTGWRYTIPLIEMGSYLAYLEARLNATRTFVELGTVRAFDDIAGAARVIVNCTGLGSRDLVPDPEVHASRGQIVVVENPGIREFFQDNTMNHAPTYILPHGDRVVLGGSIQPGVVRTEPDAAETTKIIERCTRIEPSLGDASVLAVRVGLRPSRDRIRLDITTVGSTPVIHNYGHGGAGVTLSWGCAREVEKLFRSAVSAPA